jgi:prepilin-type N-terminal cleavage/methylation domain-containing protein
MKNASKLNSNLPPLNLPLKGGEEASSINLPFLGEEQKRGLYKYNSKSAFTLVELAIVIVVIGILFAGVVVGQSLVKSAELRSIWAQQEEMKKASLAFSLEYNYWPGDFPETDQYWPESTLGFKPCNGNGNKIIHGSNYSCTNGPFPDGAISHERAAFWQHLSLAEIVPGFDKNYNALRNTPQGLLRYGNVPVYNARDSVVSVYSTGHHPSFSRTHVYAISTNLSPKDAYFFDKKFDDGYARKGNVTMRDGGNQGGCNIGSSNIWDIDNDANCGLFIRWSFMD